MTIVIQYKTLDLNLIIKNDRNKEYQNEEINKEKSQQQNKSKNKNTIQT